jgi:phospholipid/cholesterol/gamma-HCH transport system substrate-binding protein
MEENKNNPAPAEPPVAHVEAKAIFLLVLMGALIAAFLLYVMHARGVFDPVQQVILVSDDSEGVMPGMDMTFSGFPIGRVRQVDLAGDGKARITVDVPKRDAKWLRESSIFTLERGMVGDTRIKAFSGILTDPPLPDGAVRTVLRGDTAAEIPRLVATARQLLENLQAMTASGSAINTSLDNVQAVTGRLNGKYGLLGSALGSDQEAKKLIETLERVNTLLAKTDQRVYGKNGVMDDVQASVRQLNKLLEDARGTLKKMDGVLAEAQQVAGNANDATKDLGALRKEVDASLRKVTAMVDEINRKWPFKRDVEVKLP